MHSIFNAWNSVPFILVQLQLHSVEKLGRQAMQHRCVTYMSTEKIWESEKRLQCVKACTKYENDEVYFILI